MFISATTSAVSRLAHGLVFAALCCCACTAIYGDLPTTQCRTDADCREVLGLSGAICDGEYAVCLSPDSAPLADAGAGAVRSESEPLAPGCEAGDLACRWLSPECPRVSGALDDPNPIIIGTLSPHTFRAGDAEPVAVPYVSRWLDTIELGLNEWREQGPGGVLERSKSPLVLLHCNSNDDLPQARRAMAHLIDVAHAPIVITMNDNDTESVRYQALRAGTTVVCASCFALAPGEPELTSLVWQITPPLVQQAPLADWYLAALARRLRAERGVDPMALFDVVILNQTYPGIDDYVDEIERLASERGGYDVKRVTSDPSAQRVVQAEIARAVIDARPHVIVVAMDNDFTMYYLRMIEAQWPPGVPRPEYVLTYLNQEAGLFTDVVRDDDDLRRRLVGTGWGLDADVAQNLAGLEGRFLDEYSEPLENTQYGYDAFYAALYALILTDQTRPLRGPEVSLSLARLSSGPKANVGPEALRAALGFLVSSQTVDLVGSSNQLDWHRDSHETTSDVVLWCLTRRSQVELGLLRDAGPRWYHASNEISGDFACP